MIDEIGIIDEGFHVSPFGMILQNIFYGGFLAFEDAKIYFLVVSIAVLLVTSYIIYVNAKNISSSLGIWALVLSVSSADYFSSVRYGNAGCMICAFLVIAWILCDDHPIISGVLLAFAMVKPQDALIVCLAFLFMGRFVPVAIAAVIDMAAWFVVSVMIHTDIIELAREFLFASSRAEHGIFLGILSPLFDNFILALVSSMLVGIIFMYVLCKCLPEDIPKLFKIYPAFMAITFWCYTWYNDNYALIVPVIMTIWLMIKTKKLYWLLYAAYLSYSLILMKLPVMYDLILSGLYVVYKIGVIVIGIIICLKLRCIYTGKAES